MHKLEVMAILEKYENRMLSLGLAADIIEAMHTHEDDGKHKQTLITELGCLWGKYQFIVERSNAEGRRFLEALDGGLFVRAEATALGFMNWIADGCPGLEDV